MSDATPYCKRCNQYHSPFIPCPSIGGWPPGPAISNPTPNPVPIVTLQTAYEPLRQQDKEWLERMLEEMEATNESTRKMLEAEIDNSLGWNVAMLTIGCLLGALITWVIL